MVIASFIGAALGALLTLPLVVKWELGVRRVAPGLAVIGVVGGGVALALGAALSLGAVARGLAGAVLTLAGAFGVLAYRFYRDPERTVPVADDVVVSPADGEVVYVRRSEHGRLPVATKKGNSVALEELTRTPVHNGDAIVIGIGMSFLDVHVNRAPIAGRVVLRKHFPGRFGSLGQPEMVFENERATTLIEGRRFDVAVVQIASRLVRQIASYVAEGDQLALGQRIGVIRLGSQVDLVLPNRPDLQVCVQAGDRLTAGLSVVATLAAPATTPDSDPESAIVGSAAS